MTKIFCPNRPSLLGDVIFSLPVLTYFKQQLKDVYNCVYIDKGSSHIAPFLLNHPYIDKIQISELRDAVSDADTEFSNTFDIICHPYAQHPGPQSFYNFFSVQEEAFRMTYLANKDRKFVYLDPNEYSKLSKEDKFPKLYKWFDSPEYKKTIALLPFCGYSMDDPTSQKRNPPKEYWVKLSNCLRESGYNVVQYGHPKSLKLENGITEKLELGLFDMIKDILGCDLVMGTDSGLMQLIGAYGFPQVCVYTNWRENHYKNFDSLCPINYKYEVGKIFVENSLQNMNIEETVNKTMELEIFNQIG